MKRIIAPTALAGCLCLGSVTALADSHGKDMMKLAEDKQCTVCHTRSDDVPRSPSFNSIAQKYTSDDADRLVEVVLTGGEDHWGSAKMPEMDNRPEVSKEEATKLVNWILEMRSK
ncbi:cytochrome C biogenesis protein CcsA [Marinobacter maroccanus]|uniref:Cytochrome C biogenesis protein CcsA n=1 Tax=Marinobacter maroccanus TaxID=2055143 RepID=A0A2S5ZDL5_9GAMM|nr:c-type cytochrome [Marinobacter maroccanus]PPI85441.1 cytochrome C biogenesis protein CcsA [Marinobacter maroccanus]